MPETLLDKLGAALTQDRAADAASPRINPAETREQFVMAPPHYLDTSVPNNVFMTEEPVDRTRATRQYERAKHLFQALGVEVLEIPVVDGNQDATYVANIGVAMSPVVVLANYKADGRAGEVPVAKQFFEGLGYPTIQPPAYFEGEADLKKLTDQVYIGGWGQFSDAEAFRWIEQQTGRRIVLVRETSEKLYHLDCSLLVIDPENLIVVPEGLAKDSIKVLESIANVVLAPPGLGECGVTNGVKITGKKVYASGTLQPENPSYRRAMEWLMETMDRFGYVVTLLDTDEANKSGADLSCQVFHLDFPPPKPARGAATVPAGIPRNLGQTPPSRG